MANAEVRVKLDLTEFRAALARAAEATRGFGDALNRRTSNGAACWHPESWYTQHERRP